jgi:hypothetical protein
VNADASSAGLQYDGHGLLSAGASSRLLYARSHFAFLISHHYRRAYRGIS